MSVKIVSVPYREPISDLCFGQAKQIVFTYPDEDPRGEVWLGKHATLRPSIDFEMIERGVISIISLSGSVLQITGVPGEGAQRTALINRLVSLIA